MIRCTFHLNGGALSILSCPGVGFFPAYSGYDGPHRNNPDSIMIEDAGPLPTGKYYIVDRPTGGRLGPLWDEWNSFKSGSDHATWFALYRDDGAIDDLTFIKGVERKFFRLHPAGHFGVSEGCITLVSKCHYAVLRNALLRAAKIKISSSLTAYGSIQVY